MKLKIIIGAVIFVVLICAGYATTLIDSGYIYTEGRYSTEIGNIEYKGKFLMPIENFKVVTSKYGERIHPISHKKSFHRGIDLVGDSGSNILSIKEGTVTWAGYKNSYGNCVEIEHIDEDGKIFYSFYAHMRNNSICVNKGQKIEEGQVIGVQGSTGNSTGDHLHFEIRLENKKTTDPAPYLFTEI